MRWCELLTLDHLADAVGVGGECFVVDWFPEPFDFGVCVLVFGNLRRRPSHM